MRSHSQPGATIVRRTSALLSLSAITAAGLTLLALGAVRADTTPPVYHSAPLVASGDRFSTTMTIPSGDDLYVDGLTDAGQITFSAGAGRGGDAPNLLLQWSGGPFTPIVTPVSSGPAAILLPPDVILNQPVSVNPSGSAVFSAGHRYGGASWGTFRWDAATQSATPVVMKGMMAPGHLVITQPGGFAPAINAHGEMALVVQVRNPAGLSGYALYSLGQDRVLQPILLPRQELPGAAHGRALAVTDEFMMPSIDDIGRIGFLAQSQTSSGHSAYLWEFDGILPIAIVGTGIPGAGRITDVGSVSLDNGDPGSLITATTDKADSNHWGIYRVAGGKITTVVSPGSTMPGGGIFETVQTLGTVDGGPPLTSLSSANAAGEHVFLATLADGTAGAYAVDSAGQVTLLFKAIAEPKPIQIQEVGYNMRFVPGSRPCLNNRGQVAFSVRIPGGQSMIVMLTRTQP